MSSAAAPAAETDQEFLARMEREDAESFASAVASWREDVAAGGGKARVIESGGVFGGDAEEEEKAAATPPTDAGGT